MKTPERCMVDAALPAADYADAEVLVKHDYRDVKINPSMTVTFDVEDAKRQIEKDFYKANGLFLEFGA